MWRNGRRNGLKIRSREKRGMGSNPIIGTSKKAVYQGRFVRLDEFSVREPVAQENARKPRLFVK